MQRIRTLVLLAPLLLIASPTPAAASTTDDMPWDNVLSTLEESATGTIAKALVTVAIVFGGIYWSLSDDQRGLVKVLKAVVVAGIITGISGMLGSFGITMATV